MNWSPTGSTLSSSHIMGRRREGSLLQSKNWPSIRSQSSRWQGQPENSSSLSSNASGLFPDRNRVRSTAHYDESQMVSRRENDGLQHSYPMRYTPHPTGTREGALQRLQCQWHSRDTPDNSRDCGASQGNSPSPTLPFTHQGYHTGTPTYTSSYIPADANRLTTPTLHSINNPSTTYDATFAQIGDVESDRLVWMRNAAKIG